MLGEVREWTEFLEPDTQDFASMPRRELKALEDDARRRLDKEIRRFCDRNFEGMTISVLDSLFDAIKAHRGLVMPRVAFEAEYAALRDAVVRDSPLHSTVEISLWGLQFWFPEEHLANDLLQALTDGEQAMRALEPHREARHSDVLAQRDEVRDLMRRRLYAARSGLLTVFNLMECYLNSMAWEYLRSRPGEPPLSNRKRRALEDTSGTTLRDKLLKYPEIVAGTPLPTESRAVVEDFLGVVKPFRDSLVHPSPFEAPERFGGYDKLRMVYRVDVDTLFLATAMAVDLVERFQSHVARGDRSNAVPWLEGLRCALQEHRTNTAP